MFGRHSAPHDAVRDFAVALGDGVTDAVVVEIRLKAADGGTFDADVVFFDLSFGARVILEVSIMGPTLHWGEMGSTRSCGRVRRTSAIIASSGGG